MNLVFSRLAIIFFSCLNFSLSLPPYSTNPAYGALKVVGKHVTNSAGTPVQLRGMALYFSMWEPKFWNEQTILGLRYSWNSNVVRAAMGVDNGGYLTCPSCEYARITAVIDAAIKWGLYVIVDWHEERAVDHVNQVGSTEGIRSEKVFEKFLRTTLPST